MKLSVPDVIAGLVDPLIESVYPDGLSVVTVQMAFPVADPPPRVYMFGVSVISAGEDMDIEYRLRKIDFKIKSTRNKTNIFHLYHNITYSRESAKAAMQYFEKVKKNDMKRKKGLEKQ